LSFLPVRSAFGTLNLAWRETEEGPKVYRVFLPNERAPVRDVAWAASHDVSSSACPVIVALGERVQRFLDGESVDFELDLVALEVCSEFQRGVLVAEHKIPRGWVSTYGRLARHLGTPGGARAVGNALARNPFPIIIPCHRAVRADGQLGGFRGGTRMKHALLELEGVAVSQAGRVLTNLFYY
jgi:methylated-DNA-[protein]-cysteine S-methyltransferase